MLRGPRYSAKLSFGGLHKQASLPLIPLLTLLLLVLHWEVRAQMGLAKSMRNSTIVGKQSPFNGGLKTVLFECAAYSCVNCCASAVSEACVLLLLTLSFNTIRMIDSSSIDLEGERSILKLACRGELWGAPFWSWGIRLSRFYFAKWAMKCAL